MGLRRRAGVRAPGLVPIRIRLLDGAVMQPSTTHHQLCEAQPIDLRNQIHTPIILSCMLLFWAGTQSPIG